MKMKKVATVLLSVAMLSVAIPSQAVGAISKDGVDSVVVSLSDLAVELPSEVVAASTKDAPEPKAKDTNEAPEPTMPPMATYRPTPQPTNEKESILDHPEIVLESGKVGQQDFWLPQDAEVEPGTVLTRVTAPYLEQSFTLVVPELPAEQAEYLDKLGLKACMVIDEYAEYNVYHLKLYRADQALRFEVHQSDNYAMAYVRTSYMYYVAGSRGKQDEDYDTDHAFVSNPSGDQNCWRQDYWREEHDLSVDDSEYSYVVAELAEFTETSASLSEQEFAEAKAAILDATFAELQDYAGSFQTESETETYLGLLEFAKSLYAE